MTTPVGEKQVSNVTGRYTVTTQSTNRTTNSNETVQTTKISTKYYAKDGTQIKPSYYNAAEARDLANHNGYGKYYNTQVIQKDGNFYLKVTAKTKQPYGMLAQDYLKTVNDGTIKQYNPGAFEGYNCVDDAGHQMSDLNKDMLPGDSVILPIDKVEIKSSTVGWFSRNIMHIMY